MRENFVTKTVNARPSVQTSAKLEGRLFGRNPFDQISGNFGPKLNGPVRSNRKSFEKTGPPLEVDHFSRYDGLEILVEWIAPFKGGERSCRYSVRNCRDES